MSAVARLEAVLARLDARKADERVFLKVYRDTAPAEAEASDRRRGAPIGPLDGRIVSIKDIFDVAGEVTMAGSVIRRTAAPAARDALVVERLRQAGAVILGKTNTTEFCFTALGLNPHYGMPGNAVDPLRIPGGSSSGAGVSVAEGTSEISIGSDTGGSVRIPAVLNGIVGFKPTARRVPLAGVFPLSPSLDSVGPLARTVADCALADAVLSGAGDLVFEAVQLDRARIGVPRGRLLREVDVEVETAFERSLRALSRAGAIVRDVHVEDLFEAMADTTAEASIASIEAARIHADWLVDESANVDPNVSGPLRRRLGFPEERYRRIMQRRGELAVAMDQRLASLDLLAVPTVPMVAPEIVRIDADVAFASRTEGLLLRNTQIANQFDLTAITLPMPGGGLPTGLMLMARNGDDRRLLVLAATVERLLADA